MRSSRVPVTAILFLCAFTASSSHAQDNVDPMNDIAAGSVWSLYVRSHGEFGFVSERPNDEILQFLWLNHVKKETVPSGKDLRTEMAWTWFLFANWKDDGLRPSGLEVDPILETVALFPKSVMELTFHAEEDLRGGISRIADLLTRTSERIGATGEMLVLNADPYNPLVKPFTERLFEIVPVNELKGDVALYELAGLAKVGLADMEKVQDYVDQFVWRNAPNEQWIKDQVDAKVAETTPPTSLQRMYDAVTKMQQKLRFSKSFNDLLNPRAKSSDPAKPDIRDVAREGVRTAKIR